MATILITCCPQDVPRKYGYYYLKQFAQYAAELGHKVVFLSKAYLSNFQDALVKYDPRLVVMQGHGGSKGITGCAEHVILGVKSFDEELGMKLHDENPEWMNGRIVFLFSCFSGKELAPALIMRGTEAVAAFTSAYIFLTNRYPNSMAKQFIKPIITLPTMLAEGYTFGQGCDTLKSMLKANVELAEARSDELAAKYLYHDLVNFISLGNLEARL